MTLVPLRFRQEVASSSVANVPPSVPVSLALCPGWDQQWLALAEAVDHVLVVLEWRRVHLVMEAAAISPCCEVEVSNALEAASELDSPMYLSPRCKRVAMPLVSWPKAEEPSLEAVLVLELLALEPLLAVRSRGRD